METELTWEGLSVTTAITLEEMGKCNTIGMIPSEVVFNYKKSLFLYLFIVVQRIARLKKAIRALEENQTFVPKFVEINMILELTTVRMVSSEVEGKHLF